MRPFYIEEVMKKHNLTNTFSFDNDVMIYCNLDEIAEKLSRVYARTAMTAEHENALIFGMVYIRDYKALIDINVSNNKIRNSIERLDNKPLDLIYMQTNQFTGSIPRLPSSAIKAYFNNNRFLTGNIPSLSSNSLLQELFVNSCSLSGTVPPLSSCVKLKVFNASSQLGATKLNGVFGNLEYNTLLNDALIHSNQIAEWSGGVPASLGYFLAHNNNLSTASVDSILQAFVNAGRDFGTRVLNLGGSGNQAPSPAGVNNKNILIGKGWTVTTN
jgi:hypothetical protein